ncbi:ab-hydrolase associated lipase region family protein [Stylonychia lemnae]|uniref:Ab-hydrolase associated lipase region family protein n=1 Tax=Stylonychia lemnae TaxID=5949 RepID=A0A078BAB6_STYLE|nr:ab-hydrolase associated lipase region family protein [Stylonychia lemnae]|eukprot:CDW91490.1 ab-hydrolase associated lipase region family protein [Stylonychia lemnae]
MQFISDAMVSLSSKADSFKNINQIVKSHGYPFEKHHYETKDGNINMVIRISGEKGTDSLKNIENNGPKKSVVILQHGLNCSATDWILNSHNSLAFILADNGYDVWINNSRGNRYSRNHVTLDPDHDKKQYWDYSFEEMAKFDQPALFDFVLNKTGAKNVSYVGHSQGTTQMFCALSNNMDYFRSRLNLFVALAPVVKLDNCSNSLIKLVKDSKTIEQMMVKYGLYELTPLKSNKKSVAYLHRLLPSISDLGIKLLSDEDTSEINPKSIEAFMAHYPSGTSLKTLLHFKQLMNRREFRHFDYGKEENLKRYGQEDAPMIPLENIDDFPVALIAGTEDKLADIEDVRWLREQMAKQGSLIFYEEHKIGHLAFLIPKNLIVYQQVVNLLKTFNPIYVPAKEGKLFKQSSSLAADDEIIAQVQQVQQQIDQKQILIEDNFAKLKTF